MRIIMSSIQNIIMSIIVSITAAKRRLSRSAPRTTRALWRAAATCALLVFAAPAQAQMIVIEKVTGTSLTLNPPTSAATQTAVYRWAKPRARSGKTLGGYAVHVRILPDNWPSEFSTSRYFNSRARPRVGFTNVALLQQGGGPEYVGPRETSLTMTGLRVGQTYEVRIRGRDGGIGVGFAPWSDVSTVTIPDFTPKGTLPPPTLRSVRRSPESGQNTDKIEIRWNPVARAKIYRIRVSSVPGMMWGARIGRQTHMIDGHTTNPFQIRGVTVTQWTGVQAVRGTDYFFQLSTVQADGEHGPWSASFDDRGNALSADAVLSGLAISRDEGALNLRRIGGSGGFSPNHLRYEIAQFSSTSADIRITPTARHDRARITIGGRRLTNGSANTHTLPFSPTTLSITVTAQTGAKRVYTVALSLVPSTDARLRSLGVSAGRLLPNFQPGGGAYNVQVANATTAITFSPLANFAGAGITVNGGAPDAAQALDVGDNPIAIVVTAQSGATMTYNIRVTRAPPSPDASLQSLGVSRGTLRPNFTATTRQYRVEVANEFTDITFTPLANHAGARINVTSPSGTDFTQTLDPLTVTADPLSPGENAFAIMVTAQDDTAQTYTLIVTRARSTDATLRALALSTGDDIAPNFDPQITSYTASVENTTAQFTIIVTPNHAGARATIGGETADTLQDLAFGENEFAIVVTAQSGATKTYTLTVTRPFSSDATLATLQVNALGGGGSVKIADVTPAFAPGDASKLIYRAEVPNEHARVILVATPSSAHAASITGIGRLRPMSPAELPAGEPFNMDVVVTAQDASAMLTYTINVLRLGGGNGDATLRALEITHIGGAAELRKIGGSGGFAPAHLAYSADIATTLPRLTITPTAGNANSVITLAQPGESAATLSSGSGITRILQYGMRMLRITVTAQNGARNIYTLALTLSRPAGAPVLPEMVVAPGTTFTPGLPFSTTLPTASGGASPYVYAVTGDVPAGLAFNATTRVLGGIATDAATRGAVVTLIYRATDSANAIARSLFDLHTAPVSAPLPPVIRQITPKPRVVSLRWSAPASNGGAEITAYRYRFSNDADAEWESPGGADGMVIAQSGRGQANADNYDVPHDNGALGYTLAIAAVSVRGVTWSDSVTAAAAVAYPPGELAASGSSGKLRLQWLAPQNDSGEAVSRYRVRWRIKGSGEYQARVTADTADAGLAYTIAGLTNGEIYQAQVAAINANGAGRWSNEAEATPMATTPAAPAITTLRGAPAKIILAWSAPSDDGGAAITTYRYRWSNDGDANDWENPGGEAGDAIPLSAVGETNAASYEIPHDDGALEYVVALRAVNAQGGGEWSPTMTLAPVTAHAPDAPSTTGSNGKLQLTWSAPANDSGEAVTKYRVRWRIKGAGE
ncbi:MAG: cadherin-like beta sandwich domain-containing protein, partial [Gammaproteobacteria bacterium]